MKKYASYSKILEDTRVPEGAYAHLFEAKGTSVLCRSVIATSRSAVGGTRYDGAYLGFKIFSKLDLATSDFVAEGVCLFEYFLKKHGKNSRFDPLCPLIVSASPR